MSPFSVWMVAVVMGVLLWSRHGELGHRDGLQGLVARCLTAVGHARYRIDRVHSGGHGAEDGIGICVLERGPRGVAEHDEELRTLGMRIGLTCHRDSASSVACGH